MIGNRTMDPMHPNDASIPSAQKRSCEAVEAESALCGAKTRAGVPCRNLPMKNGRCRMHGGLSTGPKTAAGLARARAAAMVHGGRGVEMRNLRAMIREMRAGARRLVEMV